jgi:hypothetical protein
MISNVARDGDRDFKLVCCMALCMSTHVGAAALCTIFRSGNLGALVLLWDASYGHAQHCQTVHCCHCSCLHEALDVLRSCTSCVAVLKPHLGKHSTPGWDIHSVHAPNVPDSYKLVMQSTACG